MELALQVGQTLPDDKHICMLLVLLKLDDLFLNRGGILLPEKFLPGKDSSRSSLYGRVSQICQVWGAQFLDCLCNVGPTLILPLDVIGNVMDHLLVFDCIFHISNVEGGS